MIFTDRASYILMSFALRPAHITIQLIISACTNSLLLIKRIIACIQDIKFLKQPSRRWTWPLTRPTVLSGAVFSMFSLETYKHQIHVLSNESCITSSTLTSCKYEWLRSSLSHAYFIKIYNKYGCHGKIFSIQTLWLH